MLDLKVIFSKELNNEEHNFFQNNIEKYRLMWIERGGAYWLKFVLTLRELTVAECSNISNLASIFVDFLQRLFEQTFDSVIAFMTRVHKNKLAMQIEGEIPTLIDSNFKHPLHYKLRFAGAFVRLLNVSKVEVDFQWVCPARWLQPNGQEDAFHVHVKKYWGFDFFKILGCKKDQVRWWNPIIKEVKSKQYNPNCLPVCYSRDPLSKLEKNVSKFYSRFQRTTFEFSEVSFVPYIASKFHKVSAHLLVESERNKHCFTSAAWFVCIHEVMGLRFQDIISRTQTELAIFCKNRQTLDWREEEYCVNEIQFDEYSKKVRRMIANAFQSRELSKRPKMAHNFSAEPNDFLLEPYVLAQLPFNPMLLQQWFSAALFQILEFEKKTLELRHWPLSRDVEPCARKLLTLVKEAKECILFAVIIHSYEVSNHPSRNLNYAESIMDRCVLPATATLDFICSGSADQALKVIKNISWSQSHKVNTGGTQTFVTMSPEAYTIDKTLQVEYLTHIFHAFFVINFPDALISRNVNKENYLEHLFKTKNSDFTNTKKVECSGIEVNKFNLEEEIFYDVTFNPGCNEEINTVLVKTMEAIKKHVIEKKYFPKSSDADLLKMLSGGEAKSFFPFINKCPRVRCSVHQAIIYSQMYWRCSAHLYGIEENGSLLSWIIRLSGEVIERQLLVRLCMACCLFLGDTPVIAEQCGVESLTLETIEKSIDAVCIESKNRDRNWLWMQLSLDCRKPTDPSQNFDAGKSTLVEDLESRLRKLLLNIARSSFYVWQTNSKLFPHWSTLQYLMPCYISLLLDPHLKNDNSYKTQNLVKFLNGLLEFYETEYSAWAKAPYKWTRAKVQKYSHDLVGAANSHGISKKCLSQEISHLMYAYVGPLGLFWVESSNGETFPIQWFTEFGKWPIILSKELNEVDTLTCRTWQEVGFSHCQDVFRVCTEVWRPPSPGVPLSCKPLSDIYFSNAVISALEAVINIQDIHCKQVKAYTEFKTLRDSPTCMARWRHYLMQQVVQSEGLVPVEREMSKEDIINFCRQGNVILSAIYSIAVAFMKVMRKENIAIVKIPSFPTSEKTTLVNTVNNFFDGHFANIAKFLKFKLYNNFKEAKANLFKLGKVDYYNDKSKKLPKPKKNALLPFIRWQLDTLHRCKCCDDMETNPGSFSACEDCLSEGYPDVNYFCSITCQEIWWEREHMVEHLEFKLGLGAWYVEKKDQTKK